MNVDGAAGETIGVEEEFLLVEPERGVTVGAAGAVVGQLASIRLPGGGTVQRELRPSQIEAATGVCSNTGVLREQLRAGRRALAEAARAVDVLVVPVGTPPVRGTTAHDSGRDAGADARFARIDGLYAGVVRDYEACGLHVHIGVPDKDLAVAVVGHVNRWLPTLLALSVNSPLHDGRDTGYGSWRIVQQSRFPGSGLASPTTGYRAWEAAVTRLVDCGVLADVHQTFWFARPSPRLPTVEFRVADTAADVDDAVLQALLTRALVRTALAELDRGREAGSLSRLADAAVWSAARYGLSGPAIDLARETKVPATALVRELLLHLRDALEDTGDLDEVRALLRRTSGAARQRHLAATAGVTEVPRLMALASGGD
ncbi:carboxylate-amine ligase [Amycolatopsis pigmentata]|uniref:Putative glutamate--cysteine ligase 2 n=1 Tax=Amycolatopsis pigmentata TaxID=450801 RepID=A0ABW5FZY9_9PSEU